MIGSMAPKLLLRHDDGSAIGADSSPRRRHTRGGVGCLAVRNAAVIASVGQVTSRTRLWRRTPLVIVASNCGYSQSTPCADAENRTTQPPTRTDRVPYSWSLFLRSTAAGGDRGADRTAYRPASCG